MNCREVLAVNASPVPVKGDGLIRSLRPKTPDRPRQGSGLGSPLSHGFARTLWRRSGRLSYGPRLGNRIGFQGTSYRRFSRRSPRKPGRGRFARCLTSPRSFSERRPSSRPTRVFGRRGRRGSKRWSNLVFRDRSALANPASRFGYSRRLRKRRPGGHRAAAK